MNMHEQAARALKVTALADHLWATMSDESRRDVLAGWTLSRGDETWWQLLASAAGTKVPSQATREAVTLEICRRVNAERRFATEPHEECNGRGEVSFTVAYSDWPDMDGEAECEGCHASGKEQCHDCREREATVVTPLGFYDRDCAEKLWPVLVRPALVPSGPQDRPARAARFPRPILLGD